jgi:signal transduction histidine kinase
MKRADLERFLETTQQSAAILETNLRQASELIRGFKQVAVDQSGEQRRTVALRAYLNEVLLSLRPKLKGTRVEVELDVPEDLSTTTNVGALSQIVTNLVINSLVHGFPDGQAGTIQIQARAREREVALDYRDDGAGMDAATAHRVFEPFFTTRRGRGGSGLGMHILYNLVTGSLGGRVTCRGAPGEGVHVAISFPQHGAEGAA